MHEHSNVSAGVRAGLPLVLPTLALGVSFGVLARPVMGPLAPIAMSIFVFSGAAQFAALSVLSNPHALTAQWTERVRPLYRCRRGRRAGCCVGSAIDHIQRRRRKRWSGTPSGFC